MNKTQIIKSLIPRALLSYEKYNILPSLTIAQAILETGWLQYVKGNSILDHGKLLSFTRYKSVITSKDYKDACQNVYNSGYCSDSEYPKKLMAIIEENKLYIYDAPRSKISKKTTSTLSWSLSNISLNHTSRNLKPYS
ncbi:glucosaminidase domain-containing protein [Clostridium tagluense]|uniref:glucosaminidase domain-containing protein n=1 Tax=Clostridium tagluense TaxID=360422 RepID=UPI001C6E4B42|nr:glucosaminidase domain-containing protein [Clostridium tagluense]MBW9159479.1 glucosaminidase domain-containing protein [Clostridium tagluense]WLC68487.1 glucosaminidase domain-containing protein [Clostridium tagluense]